MVNPLKNIIRVVLVILIPVATFAQQDYKQFYTIENLISKELIKSIGKDEQVYMRITTDDGVLHYDGYQTQLFFKELPTHYTKAFLKRKNGQFLSGDLFGSENGKENLLSKYDPKLHTFKYTPIFILN